MIQLLQVWNSDSLNPHSSFLPAIPRGWGGMRSFLSLLASAEVWLVPPSLGHLISSCCMNGVVSGPIMAFSCHIHISWVPYQSGTSSVPSALSRHAAPLSSTSCALLGCAGLSEAHLLGCLPWPLLISHSGAMLDIGFFYEACRLSGSMHLTRKPGSGPSPSEPSMDPSGFLSGYPTCCSPCLLQNLVLGMESWGLSQGLTSVWIPVISAMIPPPHSLHFYLLLVSIYILLPSVVYV